MVWKGAWRHRWHIPFEVTENHSGLELRVFLLANGLLDTAGCKGDTVLTWSGSRAKGSRRRCLVHVSETSPY